jgi:HEAT repeat protein
MLGRTSSASVVPDLIRLLHDPEASVRLSAANSLFSKGRNGEQAVPDLIDLLNDEDGNVAISALWALKQVGPSEVVLPVFRKVIMAEDAGDAKFVLRVNAVNWLHTFGAEAKAAVPDLVKLIQDAERTPEDDQNRVSRASDLRFRAVESLGAIGPEATAAIPALKKLTNVEPKGFAPFMQIDGKPYFRALRDKAAEALRKIEK